METRYIIGLKNISTTDDFTLVHIVNHANFECHVLLYCNNTGTLLANVNEKHCWLVKAEKSYSSNHGNVLTIYDWFTLFTVGVETFAVFVGDTVTVYRIEREGTSKMSLIQRFVIAPNCRMKIESNDSTLVISMNDHYAAEANNLIYVVPLEQLVRPKHFAKVQLQSLPYYYAKCIFESNQNTANYVGEGTWELDGEMELNVIYPSFILPNCQTTKVCLSHSAVFLLHLGGSYSFLDFDNIDQSTADEIILNYQPHAFNKIEQKWVPRPMGHQEHQFVEHASDIFNFYYGPNYESRIRERFNQLHEPPSLLNDKLRAHYGRIHDESLIHSFSEHFLNVQQIFDN